MAGTFLGKYDTTSANNTATGTNFNHAQGIDVVASKAGYR